MVKDRGERVRLYLTLRTLAKGLLMVGLDTTETLVLTARIALDSLPPARLWAINVIAREPEPVKFADILSGSEFSGTMIRRALEDLTIFKIIVREGGNGVPATYSKSKRLKDFLAIPTLPVIYFISLEKERDKECHAGSLNNGQGTLPEIA